LSSRLARVVGIAVVALAPCGCATAPLRMPSLDEVEQVRASEAAHEGSLRAPEVFVRAEQERGFAIAAHARGDDVAAKLHAERAIAAYGHALVVARLAAALAERADAQHALDDAAGQEQALEASRASLEAAANVLQDRARIARERLMPAASDASTSRAAARLAAARSLAVEARLFCAAARLVAADATDVAAAEADVAVLDADLERASHPARPRPATTAKAGDSASVAEPIDEGGAARARCLDVLTRARRGSGDDGRADALMAELSASGAWAPVRDERGVVVTLRGAFRGAELTEDGQSRLKSLGQVAAAHPGFAVQVVVHDAQPSAAPDADARRGDATVKVLVAAGAAAARVKAELAGALVPVVDPSDAAYRARNERIDVVFVAGS
jgi:flagellar motor protein MotB